jgi:cbb3-type cytochrome oxidase cytochrome c subunit
MFKILEKTPGLLFTMLLLAFVIGTMVDSVLDAKEAAEVPKTETTEIKK